MEGIGIVRKVYDGRIIVEFMKKSACGDSCDSCNAHCAESQLEYLEFKNTISAKVGDLVKLNVNEKSVFNYKLLVYGMPLVFLIMGISIAYSLLSKNGIKNVDLISLIIGLCSMAVSYLIINKIDKKFGKNSSSLMILEKM